MRSLITLAACWLIVLGCLQGHAVFAAEDVYQFETEQQRERFQRFTRELRCPKCQSQTLAGSNSQVSQDLKRELHRLIVAGKTDEEVVDFMVSRYTDFVLYKPPVQENTYLLWFGPVILLLVGLAVFGWILLSNQRKKRPSSNDTDS